MEISVSDEWSMQINLQQATHFTWHRRPDKMKALNLRARMTNQHRQLKIGDATEHTILPRSMRCCTIVPVRVCDNGVRNSAHVQSPNWMHRNANWNSFREMPFLCCWKLHFFLSLSRSNGTDVEDSGREKRSAYDLYSMVKCSTGCDPLLYKGYGCYCGFLGNGRPLDGIDRWVYHSIWMDFGVDWYSIPCRCCKAHDNCYEVSSCPKYLEYFVPYVWKCYRGKPICGESKWILLYRRNNFIQSKSFLSPRSWRMGRTWFMCWNVVRVRSTLGQMFEQISVSTETCRLQSVSISSAAKSNYGFRRMNVTDCALALIDCLSFCQFIVFD